MKNYKINKKFQFLFPFFFIIGVFLIIAGFNDKKVIDLTYNEDNSIHYNVFLKENKFFDSPYIGEGRTYIASLIDYIDINFHYNLSFSEKINGNCKYKYVALVRANKKEGSGYYWEKEYDLTDEKVAEIKNKSVILINDNIKVNYDTYNDILNTFKKEYNVTPDGELKVIMKINNTANLKDVNEPVAIDSEMNLSIPLLEQSIEVAINKDNSTTDNISKIRKKSDRPAYLIFKVTGIVLSVVSVLGFIDVTKTNIIFKKANLYDLKLDGILSSYDSIIANIKFLPDMTSFNKIEVSSFEELLDVYNEVRMPINYYHDKNKSTFVIINDSIAWIFNLKKDALKWADSNEKKEINK